MKDSYYNIVESRRSRNCPEAQLVFRDLQASNVLFSVDNPFLIGFGWAVCTIPPKPLEKCEVVGKGGRAGDEAHPHGSLRFGLYQLFPE